MFGFWEIAVVIVVAIAIGRIAVYIKRLYEKSNEKNIKGSDKEDLGIMLVGGLLMLFIGLSVFTMSYSASGLYVFVNANIIYVSFLLGSIGTALILSFYILYPTKTMKNVARKPAKKTARKIRKKRK